MQRLKQEAQILAEELKGVVSEFSTEKARCKQVAKAVEKDVKRASEKHKRLKEKGEVTDADLKELVEARDSIVQQVKGCGVTEEQFPWVVPGVVALRKKIKVWTAWQAVQKDVKQAADLFERLTEADEDITSFLRRLAQVVKSSMGKLHGYGVTEKDVPELVSLYWQIMDRATCKPGQIEASSGARFKSNDNSWIKCRERCLKDFRCSGFDYTIQPGADACRGAERGENPRFGVEGLHNRNYCDVNKT